MYDLTINILNIVSKIQAEIINCTFYNNSVSNNGGAVYISNFQGIVTILNSNFNNNKGSNGGAIWIDNTITSINSCIFNNNRAIYGGGGIFWNYANNNSLLVTIDDDILSYHNNHALYGQNYATNGILLRPERSIRNVSSGVVVTPPFKIHLEDYYGQTVHGVEEVTVSLIFATVVGNKFSISGSTIEVISNGSAIFASLVPNGLPGDTVILYFNYSTNTVESVGVTMTFQPCQAGFISENIGNNAAICFNCTIGTFSLSTSDTECTICPSNAYCPGSNILNVDSGYWRQSDNSAIILECPVSNACLGGDKIINQCATGHIGPLCDVCEDGYYRDSQGLCLQCTERIKSLSIFVSFFILILIIITIHKQLQLLIQYIANQFKAADSIKFRSFRVKFKILIAFYQISSQIGPSTSVIYGIEYNKYLNGLDFLNFNIFTINGIGCLFRPSFYNSLIIITVIPFIILVLLGLILLLRVKYSKRMNERNPYYTNNRATKDWISIALYISFISLSPVSIKIFELFACQVFPDGSSYLVTDYSVSCQTPVYNNMIIYGSIMLIIYPIGIPLSYGVLLLYYRKKINPHWTLVIEGTEKKVVSEKILEAGQIKIRKSYKDIGKISFLFDSYTPKRWLVILFVSY